MLYVEDPASAGSFFLCLREQIQALVQAKAVVTNSCMTAST